ncbi:ATP-dependent helicase HrpB [Arthrobacter psychrolactophilus]|uniref:ATP-dependent helicase HrpB n=1 Tax=Arthrobacter psychrolactophilus TaxID=92442 RepID=A0A2V5IKH8_9MICC|nr:ATP-dependent helicase HrpB [Arthrobacter psychrolactophilus]PYI37115.1 ATP-dependent helicase HrpB [Arthrobacter psychrolactophilus]
MSNTAQVAYPGGPFSLATLGQGLIFAQSLPQLAAVLGADQGAAAVVQAPPGTGKTTLVPPLVANVLNPSGGPAHKILVTQPRRVAVRSAARRLATLDGSPLGSKVGYTVRGESHTSPDTIVEFLTPGILLRRLLRDPGLESVAAVVLDEVHERGLDTDLLLGMLAEVRELRGDLTLIAMSATLDAARFAELLGTDDDASPAPVVDCPSALFPLEVRWAPSDAPRMDERGISRAFLDHVADTAAAAHASALAANPDVDALVFAPGAWEVSHIAARLRNIPGREILELHGQVSARDQDRAVAAREPGGAPRIIVSTSLAESSLTVPGVRLVIDSGLSREPRRDSARGMTGLVTVSTSRASAEQRAGRAARLGPGTVVRCYDQKTFAAAPAHPMPEIAVADLSAGALMLACWGAPGGAGLRLPEAPPAQALAAAVAVLTELGAVDHRGHATALGRTLAEIPAGPRLARALLDGAAVVGAKATAEIVALVAGEGRAPGADLTMLLSALRSGRDPGTRRWQQEVRRLEGLLRKNDTAATGSAKPARSAVPAEVSDREAVGFVVGLAFPDRLARRVAGTENSSGQQYLLSSGTRAGLPVGSSLSGHEWLAVAEVARAQGRDAAGTGAVIRSAAPFDLDLAPRVAATLLEDSVEATFVQGKVSARRVRRLGAVVLSATPVKATAAQGREAVMAALAKDGLGVLHWNDSADALRRRLALLHRELGAPWPDVSDAALLDCLPDWLGPELESVAAGRSLSALSLSDPLRRLLPWPEAAQMAELLPETLVVPSGSHIRIEYPEVSYDGPPVVAVKLQECFGLADTPRLLRGRVKVLFHLLSPARRPLAVTDDLASFWSGPYAQVRAEMRGRYPKHPWPEDPWSAPATAKVKSRM